jgi:hypothetical protein
MRRFVMGARFSPMLCCATFTFAVLAMTNAFAACDCQNGQAALH